MKIVVATILRREGTTGVQTHFNALLHGLHSESIDVEYIDCFSSLKPLYLPIYAVRPLFLRYWLKAFGVVWYRFWHTLFLFVNLARFLRNNTIDIVNAQCPLSALAALQVRRFLGLNFKIALTCHYNISQAIEFQMKGEIAKDGLVYNSIIRTEKKILGAVDGIVFVSKFSQTSISAFHGVTLRNATVIHNGADKTAVTGIARAQLGIDDSAFVIACVGTLEPRKNQGFLLDVMHHLSAEPGYLLLLVGDGPDKGRLLSRIQELKLQGSVTLLGYRQDIPELLHAANALCHPALMENCPIVIVEALAQGLPILASPVGGIPELLQDNGTGYLLTTIKTDDSKEYAATIRELRHDTANYSRLARNASAYHSNNLTRKRMVRRYIDYYASLINTEGSTLAKNAP